MNETPSWKIIVADYGEVLESAAKVSSIFPESKLPYSRQTIKQALIQGLIEIGSTNRYVKNAMECSFTCLSHFVRDNAAEFVEKQEMLMQEFSKMNPNKTDKGQAIELAQAILNGSSRYEELLERTVTEAGKGLDLLRSIIPQKDY